MTAQEKMKELDEIIESLANIRRQAEIAASNAKRVAAAIAYEAKREEAGV